MHSKPYRFDGRTALITGAASGIGRALACELAKRNAHLALADLDERGLQETRALLASDAATRVSTHVLDVADREAVAALPSAVLAHHPGVDVLVNNAGVAVGGSFEQIDERDFEWLFEINFWGVVRMTRAFLPILRASDDAALVNVSSIFGIIAPPGQTAYSASKFAVRGFTASLRNELSGSSIFVSTVHPGGIATAIAANAREPKDATAAERERYKKLWQRMLKMRPETAATIVADGIERRNARILVGDDAKTAAWAERLAPVSYGKLLKLLSRT
ncbi:MAG TPA: SDR family oxidoreductase [Candidatus Aquilonibacter sp.]|nr:SDR family oxidoreductase [Candidatus Aquilonibacter sp.]